MRSILLLAMLLCILCAAQVQTQDNNLKLCGRALLRAVVYTCGGSRWRRGKVIWDAETLPDVNRETDFSKTPVMDRRWRDQNQALISVCCQEGCRRSDLSMLC